jgi:hypothetical protein
MNKCNKAVMLTSETSFPEVKQLCCNKFKNSRLYDLIYSHFESLLSFFIAKKKVAKKKLVPQ